VTTSLSTSNVSNPAKSALRGNGAVLCAESTMRLRSRIVAPILRRLGELVGTRDIPGGAVARRVTRITAGKTYWA
jgi:hypothetical protein